jgi:hypothetical protein
MLVVWREKREESKSRPKMLIADIYGKPEAEEQPKSEVKVSSLSTSALELSPTLVLFSSASGSNDASAWQFQVAVRFEGRAR